MARCPLQSRNTAISNRKAEPRPKAKAAWTGAAGVERSAIAVIFGEVLAELGFRFELVPLGVAQLALVHLGSL